MALRIDGSVNEGAGMNDDDSREPEGIVGLPAPIHGPRAGVPDATGDENQAPGDPPEVRAGILGAALDSLSGLRSHVVNIVAVAAFHDNQRRAELAERSADDFRTRYHDRDKEKAVLDERLGAFRERARFRAILLSVGGPVFGAGLTLLIQSTWAFGATLLLLGGFLMGLGHGVPGGRP